MVTSDSCWVFKTLVIWKEREEGLVELESLMGRAEVEWRKERELLVGLLRFELWLKLGFLRVEEIDEEMEAMLKFETLFFLQNPKWS